MSSKLLLLFLFTIFLVPEQFLISQIKFAVIGDFGDSTDSQRPQQVADLINGLVSAGAGGDFIGVDFIVTAGDNYYNATDANYAASLAWIDADIGKFYSDWIGNYQGSHSYGSGSTTNKFFPVAGNHEFYHKDSSNAYTDYFTLPGAEFTNTSGNERYYDFVWGDKLHFFMLSNYGVGVTEYDGQWGATPRHGNYGEPDGVTSNSVQANWFYPQIDNCVLNHSHWRIVVVHHSPYSSGKSHGSNLAAQWPYKAHGAQLVLSAHDHVYERLIIDGLTYVVNGLGGKSRGKFDTAAIVPGSVASSRYRDNYGALLFETIGETQLKGQFITRLGTQKDVFIIEDTGLPVELVFFTGSLNGNNVELRWRTETEVNNYGFYIERSAKNSDWLALGFVEGNGNSNSPKHYTFIDSDIYESDNYYYRLKQIDNDGTFEYSDVVTVTVGIPVLFILSQNYPNPFNPETRIDYTLPEQQNVSLRVYNMLGEIVRELVNEVKEAGTYSVTFDASNLPSGIYIYRIQTESFATNKKMTFLK
jgi:Calcineurin-like phosphoesterase/Secretion system C-terminal sorting domain